MPIAAVPGSNAAVEISWGAPNYRTDLSRYWAEVHHIVVTSGGDTAA